MKKINFLIAIAITVLVMTSCGADKLTPPEQAVTDFYGMIIERNIEDNKEGDKDGLNGITPDDLAEDENAFEKMMEEHAKRVREVLSYHCLNGEKITDKNKSERPVTKTLRDLHQYSGDVLRMFIPRSATLSDGERAVVEVWLYDGDSYDGREYHLLKKVNGDWKIETNYKAELMGMNFLKVSHTHSLVMNLSNLSV